MEGLHRQVMPFVLRRTKDAVLSDLPPKIVQDIVCEPSPLQRELYQEFHNSQVGGWAVWRACAAASAVWLPSGTVSMCICTTDRALMMQY